MKAPALHPWDLSPNEAMRLQKELAARVICEGEPARVRYIAGADVAFDKPNGRGVGAIVVVEFPSLDEVERVSIEVPVSFPYIPGLLSFRETPVILAAFEQLQHTPDLVMVDGHGYAHPRRFGYACHVGVLLDTPTIGVAKSRLIGEPGTVAGPRGSRADVVDQGEVIGSMLRSRPGVRSIYVSVGHRIGLPAAERWALACGDGYRVPRPTRLADRAAGEAKRRMVAGTLEILIEQRAGEAGRWEWDPADNDIRYKHDLPGMVTHYGCSVDIVNPADGDMLDVMLADERARDRGERLRARVIDVLERSDGDHKVLAMPLVGAPSLTGVRERIWEWYVSQGKPVTRWAGEDAAIALIAACRAASEVRT
jgi:deoxyribonuclease V